MRVLIPLKNFSKSNLDNSESNSVNQGVGEQNNNGEVILVHQSLQVGETLEVPVKNIYIVRHSKEQQKQQQQQQPGENWTHPSEVEEAVASVGSRESKKSSYGVFASEANKEKTAPKPTVVDTFLSGKAELATPLRSSTFYAAHQQQQKQQQRRLRKRPKVSIPTSFKTSTEPSAFVPTNSVAGLEVSTSSQTHSPFVGADHISFSSLGNHHKRYRPDSKPAAKISVGNSSKKLAPDCKKSAPQQQQHQQASRSSESSSKMTAGGRRNYESDDDDIDDYGKSIEPWINNMKRPSGHRQHAPVQLLLTPAENEPPYYPNEPTVSIGVARKPQVTDHDHLDVTVRSNSPTSPPLSTGPTESVTGSSDDGAVDLMSLYNQAIKKLGFEIVEQEGDGNCLFRAVSLQVYGHADHHAEVRERCMDFMASNAEHYSNFVVADDYQNQETFAEYIARKRQLGVHGNHAEMQAISELYNRPIEVYTPDDLIKQCCHPNDEHQDLRLHPMNIFHTEYKTSDVPIRLSYHDGNHYNAIIDPLVPTAGLGLGLPGLQPGLADKMQVAAAVTESDQLADQMELERVLKESATEHKQRSVQDEDDDLQRALKESAFTMDFMLEKKAMALSDLDATNFELEQEALAGSWDSYGRQEHGCKQRASPSTGVARRRSRSSVGVAPTANDSSFLPVYAEPSSSVAAASIPPVAASAFASVASSSSSVAAASSTAAVAVAASFAEPDDDMTTEYPQTVQELVMNGFELKKVIRAYELVGDNFDDLLAFLISTSSTSSS